jgi:hypothetical protein
MVSTSSTTQWVRTRLVQGRWTISPRGHLVNFGQVSGAVSPFEISRLAAGSYTVSRPILFHYLTEQSERDSLVAALFGALQRKALTAEAVRSFSLAQAGVAQAELESPRRQTHHSTALTALSSARSPTAAKDVSAPSTGPRPPRERSGRS